MDLICPCTNVFPAYAHVRTEPFTATSATLEEKKIDHPNSIVGDLHPIVDPAIPLGLDPELAKIVVFPMLPAIRHGVRLVAPGAKTMDWDLQARDC